MKNDPYFNNRAGFSGIFFSISPFLYLFQGFLVTRMINSFYLKFKDPDV